MSCKKESETINNTTSPQIFAVGSHNNFPTFWKNGVATILPHGNYYTDCTSMFVSGEDVYISGNDYDASNYHTYGRIWKNGISVLLSLNCYYKTIIVSGADTYIGGSAEDGNAQIWKNGIPMPITNGIYGGTINSIYLSSSDVYACGAKYTSLPTSTGMTSAATIWKNGIPTELTNGNGYDRCESIAVTSSGDVYVAGSESNGIITSGKIWKNGINSTTIDNSSLYSICVLDTNVYAGGVKGFAAITTKNGNLNYISDINNPNVSDLIYSLHVVGTDVYAGGYSSNASLARPTIWKNGTPTYLTSDNLLGEVVSIFIR